ncbi:WYL domain-containing protein [Massilia arenae]|uniref:WYL domain-containing protein n=1 Tax=Massilia arenae TaxID=2603288 RepID=A0A5C7FZ48_9BURK|nr:WYL domain-containing protein [Massilia arenae]
MRRNDDGTVAGEVAAKPKKAGKNGAEHTLRRRLALLTLLPYGNQAGVCARVLTEKLNRDRYACTKRTVERDLEEMSGNRVWREVGIDIQWKIDPSDSKTYLWAHMGPGKPLYLRQLSGEDALLIALMAQELQHFLPKSVSSVLTAYQPRSDNILSLPGHTDHGRYHAKVRSLADGPLMHPPAIDDNHVREINEALLRDEQIALRYRPASRDAEHDYRLHPVGMVKKGLFIWLIAFKEEDNRLAEGARTFRMDRVISVRRREN